MSAAAVACAKAAPVSPSWDKFRYLARQRFRYKSTLNRFIRWYQEFFYACSESGGSSHPSNEHFRTRLKLPVATQNRYKAFAIEIGAMERRINGHEHKLNSYELLVKP